MANFFKKTIAAALGPWSSDQRAPDDPSSNPAVS